MAKFDLSKKRKRKVKRKKKQSTPKEERKSLNLELIPISEKLPPQKDTQILVWDNDIGWYLSTAILVYQHYFQDIKMFGYSRARYWTHFE